MPQVLQSIQFLLLPGESKALLLRWQDPPAAEAADGAWRNHALRRELDGLVQRGSLKSVRMLSLRYDEPEDTLIR